MGASHTVGKVLKKGDYVVYESTVYPGCTEEDCKPVLELESGLTFGPDFKLGYSHGGAVAVIVDGCPPNLEINENDIQQELDRRKPQ